MRLQLNLNQYYEGLNISQTNAIFSKFIDLKRKIEQIKITLNKPEEKRGPLWKVTLEVYSESIFERVNEINSYMESIGKERIFDVGKSIDDTNFENIISKYEYLMSTHEKDNKIAEEPKGYEER